MGSADLVPGVSGGTIAFIAGVYEELIHSIKVVSGEVVKLLFSFKIKEALAATPLAFLLPLFVGIASAFLLLSRGLEYLLFAYPVYLWSLFFGLIVASAWVVRKRVNVWTKNAYISLFLALIFAFYIVGAAPTQTPATYPYMFVTGAIAICAMILPGVSGSFLLVILGKYEQILTALVSRDIITLGVVALGAVVGLAVFSRVLSWLFENYHDVVVAALTGFMIGSLRKVWPWKDILKARLESDGHIVPLLQLNKLPDVYSQEFFIASFLALIGAGLILWLSGFDVEE